MSGRLEVVDAKRLEISRLGIFVFRTLRAFTLLISKVNHPPSSSRQHHYSKFEIILTIFTFAFLLETALEA